MINRILSLLFRKKVISFYIILLKVSVYFAIFSLIWKGLPYVGIEQNVIKICILIAGTMTVFAGYFGYCLWKKKNNLDAYNYKQLIVKIYEKFKPEDGLNPECKIENQIGFKSELVNKFYRSLHKTFKKLGCSYYDLFFQIRNKLYGLPWVMILGAKQTGKTSLLYYANLKFPFLNQVVLNERINSGTKSIKWWLNKDVIFLDTPPALFSNENEGTWQAILKTLAKCRSKLPLNAVILTFSMFDIFTDFKKVSSEILSARLRLDAYSKKTCSPLPVFIVITQLDKISGFFDFFEYPGTFDLNQALGFDLTGVPNSMILENFSLKLDALLHTLNYSLLERIGLAHTEEKKLNIITFMQKFESARVNLCSFVNLITNMNPYQSDPEFKGLYFSAINKESGEAWFVEDLIRLITHEAKAVMPASYFKIVNRINKHVYCYVLAGTLIFLSSWLCFSFYFNKTAIKSAKIANTGLYTLLNSRIPELAGDNLDKLYRVVQHYSEVSELSNNTPYRFGLGLYQGKKELKVNQSILVKTIKKYFLDEMIFEISKQLRILNDDWLKSNALEREKIRLHYYQTLKIYLSITLGKPLVANDFVVKPIFTSKLLSSAKAQKVLLYYLDNVTQLEPYTSIFNEGSISIARQNLNLDLSDERGYYAFLKNQYISTLPQLDINEMMGDYKNTILLKTNSISKFYTIDSWHKIVKTAIHALAHGEANLDWVIHMPIDVYNKHYITTNPKTEFNHYALEAALIKLYFKDYVEQWLNVVKNIKISNFSNFEDGVQKLNSIQHKQGCYYQVIKLLHSMFDFDKSSITEQVAEIKILKDLPFSIVEDYSQLMPDVISEFNTISYSVDASDSAKIMVEKLLMGQQENNYALSKSVMQSKLIFKQLNNSKIQCALIEGFNAPFVESWILLQKEALKKVQVAWQKEVITFYEQKLQSSFPFATKGHDTPLSDFEDFMHPHQGIYWKFVNVHLSPLMKLEAGKWQPREWLNVAVPLGSVFLEQMQKMSNLTKVFYHNKENTLKLQVQFYPSPSPNISELSIKNDNSFYSYRNEPEEWHMLNWPGTDPLNVTQIKVVLHPNNEIIKKRFEGSWGLLRMLGLAHLEKKGFNNRYKGTWIFKDENKKPLKINFSLQSPVNLFELQMMLGYGFDLPKSVER